MPWMRAVSPSSLPPCSSCLRERFPVPGPGLGRQGADIALTKPSRSRRGNGLSFLNRRRRRVRPGRQLSSRCNRTQLPGFKSPPSLSLVTREQQLECTQDFRGCCGVQFTNAFQRGRINRAEQIAGRHIIASAPANLHAKRGERNVFAERANQLRGQSGQAGMLQTDEIGSRDVRRGGIQRQIHSCR